MYAWLDLLVILIRSPSKLTSSPSLPLCLPLPPALPPKRSLLESTLLDFAALAPRVLPPGIGRDPLASRLVRAVARRVDGAAAALLRHERSGREVLAAAVHLFWDPAYPDVKVC